MRLSFLKVILIPLVISSLGLGFSNATYAKSRQLWSEKTKAAKKLVSLPSIQPVIKELDATIVNISSTTKPKQMKSKQDRQDNRHRNPTDPFMNPEDFFERFFGQTPRSRPRRSMGSGFIISPDGYILTNNHVVEGADKIEVTVSLKPRGNADDSEQQVYSAKVIGRDPHTDIALVKIKPKEKLPYSYLGNSDVLKKGDWVVAMGNPFGLDHSVSIGIVSAKGREISSNENRRFDDFIQTDAAINFGNSGGPLVNVKGEVVGINTAITAQGSGIGFAIPINMAKNVLPQLKEKGSVSRGYLGVMIQDVTEEMKNALGLDRAKGVLVNDTAPGGPASKSALKPGDVIVRVNGIQTPDAHSLQRIIGRMKPGAVVNLRVYRKRQQLSMSLKLGALDESQKAKPKTQEQKTDKLGLFVAVSPQGGLEIQDVDPESSPAKQGLIPGDRIIQITFATKDYEMKSLRDYERLLKKIKSGDSVVLRVVRQVGPDQKASIYVGFKVP